MTAQPDRRQFSATDAAEARSQGVLPLLVGLIGPSGSGKTFSALRIATGIQSVVGGEVFVIDTEQRRALHYARDFTFKHVPFGEPFGSLDYLEAIRFCKKSGAGVVVIDSCSHEHDGPGGLLEQHDAELTRMAGNDYGKRDRMTMLAWQKPKAARRKLIAALTTELNMPVVFCFRARTTVKPVPGKQPVDMGFSSIGADEWIFEMALSALLLPGSNGVPTWQSDKPGEKLAIKLPRQFRSLGERNTQLDEAVGERLARWATGKDAPAKATAPTGERFAAHDVGTQDTQPRPSDAAAVGAPAATPDAGSEAASLSEQAVAFDDALKAATAETLIPVWNAHKALRLRLKQEDPAKLDALTRTRDRLADELTESDATTDDDA